MIAKVTLFFTAVAVANAMVAPLINTGVSASTRKQDAHGNYAFGYEIKDKLGATNSRSEVGDGYGNKKGSYSLADIDGRARVVEYVADGHGFRAVVKTNEPGTALSAPAAAVIDSPYGTHAAPVINHVAPAVVAAPVAVATIGHGGAIGLGGAGLGLANGVGYGAGLGLANGVGYGAGIGLANGVGYGAGIGLGKGIGLGLGNGIGLATGAGWGVGAGIGKGLLL